MTDDILTVYGAELARRLTSKPFLIGLAAGVLFIVLFTKIPQIFAGAFEGSKAIALAGDPSLTARAKPLLEKDFTVKTTLPIRTFDSATLKRNGVSGVFDLNVTGNTLHVTVYANDPSSMETTRITRDLLPLQLQVATHRSATDISRISAVPVTIRTVASKFASSDQATAARVIAYTLIFFLYILILLNSQLVMGAVAEEKTSRIAELLIASVSPVALLSGKILAAVTLAVLQMLVWCGAMVLLGGSVSASSPDASPVGLSGVFDVVTPGVLVAFILFFIIGLFQLSTMFAAAASLVNRTEDLGSITMPLIFAVVAALFVAIGALGTPDAPWAVACSFVPLVSAFVMFARIAVGTVPAWQIVLSLAINLAALWCIAVIAGKIYRVGMLLYGRTPKFSQIWSVLRS